MTSLFSLAAGIATIEYMLDRMDIEKDIGGEVEADLARLLQLPQSEEELRTKVDNYVSYERHLQAREKARREEAKHLEGLAQSDARKITRMKEAVRVAAGMLGRTKLEGHTRTITVSQSKKPALTIDADALPAEYKTLTAKESWNVDRKALTAHIMTTGEVPDGVTTRLVTSIRFR